MASQAFLSPDRPFELQRDVQRKLGRCLLRLQQYEILLKALVTYRDIAGPPAGLQGGRDAQVACHQMKPLGNLVVMLTERHLISVDEDDSVDEPLGDGGAWCRLRFQVGLDASQHQATTAALKELVGLRNELVHHFLQRFNIWEPHGCLTADIYLDTSDETDQHSQHYGCGSWQQVIHESRQFEIRRTVSPEQG